MKPHLGLIEIHPAPYRNATLELVKSRNNVELTVVSLFSIDYGHTYRPEIVPSYSLVKLRKCIRFKNYTYYHPNNLQTLLSYDFDVILIPGYRSITSQASILYCLLKNKPFIFSMDSILFPNHTNNNKKKFRNIVSHKFFNIIDSFWVPGEASRQYLQSYGVEEERIFQGAYCLDREGIIKDCEAARPLRNLIRAEIGVHEKDWLFLFVGRIEEFRGLIYLIKSFAKLEKEVPESHLLIIGDGSDRINIESECRRRNLKNVVFLDPMPMDKLINYYVAADTYVMPGLRENYSLSLAQAAICGIPMISTNTVGAIKDYLINGYSGLLVKSADIDSLYRCMYKVVMNREFAHTMGENAKHISVFRTPSWAANQLESAVFKSLEIHKNKR